MHPQLAHPSTTFQISTPTDRSIEIRREFAAPRDLVWDAWTRPALLRRWYGGPSGWHLDECEIDLRVGGAWRYLVRHESGQTMVLAGVYQVVETGSLLVTTESNDDCEARTGSPDIVTTTEFDEVSDGRCLIVSTLLLATPPLRDALLASGMDRGLVASYERMDLLFADLAS